MSAKVMGWAMDQVCGSPMSKLVLIKLGDNANDKGVAWPSISHLVRHTELCERTVQVHLRKLEEAGLIVTLPRRSEDGASRSNVYQLMIPGVHVPRVPAPDARNSAGGAGTRAGGAGGVVQEPPPEPSSLNLEENHQGKPAAKTAAGPAPKVSNRRTQIGAYSPSAQARDKAVAYWRKHGRPDLVPQLDDQIDRFIAFHSSRGSAMVDWESCFKTWYCNALSHTRPPNPSGPTVVPFAQEDRVTLKDWEQRLRVFYGYCSEGRDGVPEGTWLEKWGPRPGEKGCRVMPEAFKTIKPRKGAA